MDLSSNVTRRPLCVKGCGFYGSEETKNMCSSCYNHFLKTQLLIDKTTIALDRLSLSNPKPSNPLVTPSSDTLFEDTPTASRLKNRCNNCNKKVGLMGFKCRCRDLFCAKHRYATEHSCPFDYKKFDREILIKENQLIKADKLAERI
ncbi:hypothetical protein JRO89_XS11G0167500 [Xanthoceras sorbifolium]|uniref:Uncharacterized protein n=1 Tax=Xanthoceras sorbifolium TaxID=99658 RepID=A0ABQ8HFY9_9ROSI|nr:hypothetical protein JRO89_XS11G0167500 [Xanthoceras sorbifolium]